MLAAWKRLICRPPRVSVTAPGAQLSTRRPSRANEEDALVEEESEDDGATATGSLVRASVPDFYPEVIAVPVGRRPVFPGFYKTVTITDPRLARALTQALKKGRPYVGIFMSRKDAEGISDGATDGHTDIKSESNDNAEKSTLKSLDDIYPVGVFAQIINVVPTPAGLADDGEADAIFPPKADAAALTAIVYPHRRIHATELLTPGDAAVARVMTQNVADEPFDRKDQTIRAISQEIFAALADVAKLNTFFREHIAHHNVPPAVFENPSRLADFVAVLSSSDGPELQALLAETHVEERLRKALLLLKKELVTAQLQHSIARDVEQKLTQKQREYFLHEQLKAIKRELGLEADSRDKVVQGLEKRAAALTMPPAVRSVFDEEIAKLAVLEPAASEFSVTRNYLDWLTALPWGKRSAESLDISAAAAVLDEDHYGMDDVKERILEFIAVGRLRGGAGTHGKIMCLVGPPGVGKTSIGRSIARALGRKYFRFSVGGLADVSEIKGHRRTYVGAMPGKAVQALKTVQTENPLILIDEIDKLGRGVQGDPASALLELLDPEQNSAFMDHYLDVPLDMSNVLFMCTANTADTIPAPLLDRMEVLTLSGYVAAEKTHIAERYLIPQARDACGLRADQVVLAPEALEALIRQYCRESGVRSLKQHIEKIFRKAALRLVKASESANSGDAAQADLKKPSLSVETLTSKDPEFGGDTSTNQETLSVDTSKPSDNTADTTPDPKSPSLSGNQSQLSGSGKSGEQVPAESKPLIVDSSNLKDFVGSPVYTSDRLYDGETLPAGVVTGLAWTANGGSILYVETIPERMSHGEKSFRPGIMHTGQMGDVMKESTAIAYSFAKAFVSRHWPACRFFDETALHLHVPEGATPKDGPSAGCTMASSLVSLALDRPLKADVAMTGELTLTGKVLRIGGVREKTVAARRAGVRTIILPRTNEADWNELPTHIREGLEVCFVSTFEDVARAIGLLETRND